MTDNVIEMLEKSLVMWNWLADTGKTKDDYFKSNNIPLDDVPFNYCYLCDGCLENLFEVPGPMFIVHCENCPINWDSTLQDEPDCIYCEQGNSPYRKWRNCNSEDSRKFWAGAVANKIKIALDMIKLKASNT